MRFRRAPAIACAVALLSGCSGNAAVPASTNAAVSSAPAGAAHHEGESATVAIHLRVPRRHRRTHYVSPATAGVTFAFTGPTNLNESFGVTPQSDPNCETTTSGTSCTFSIVLAPGSYAANVATYDRAPEDGVIPIGAHLLATAANVAFVVKLGAANQFDCTLEGVVSTLTIVGIPATGTTGTPIAAQPFTVTARDYDNYVIVGTYENRVLLGDTDGTGATTIATSGSDDPPNSELLSSSDAATFAYNGAVIPTATISANATASTVAQAFFQTTGQVVVTLATDSNAGTPPGTGAGVSGDLRYALLNAGPGQKISFNCGSPCTITLSGPLPAIEQDQIVDGGIYPNVIIDGADAYRAFFVDNGNVTIAHLKIEYAFAQGGAGGDAGLGGGGGGAGLGAGLFVNQVAANVTVQAVYFLNCAVVGGKGGSAPGAIVSDLGGGGGGGLGGAGGAGVNSGGNGGGGFLFAGNGASGSNGANGAVGGGGGGGGDGSPGVAGTGGSAVGTNGAGSPGSPGSAGAGGGGGAGGFGGGGGGGGGATAGAGGGGGAGGFGAGGGAAGSGASGSPSAGAGGLGGGGGGGPLPGAGGSLGVTATGGHGDANYNGGGGAAAGPAIFVNAGSVNIVNSGTHNCTAAGGAAGGGSATAGSADSTPVFSYLGNVNGYLQGY